MMKNWLICNYGSPSRIVGDIVSSLAGKNKPGVNNKKVKFIYFSAIIRDLQRLEKLSRRIQVNKEKLESCLLSRSTNTSLVNLLPSAEHDLWVREMTYAGLDFRNPEGSYTLACLKRCVSSKGILMKILEKPVLLCPVVQISAAKRCRLASNYLLSEKNKKVPG